MSGPTLHLVLMRQFRSGSAAPALAVVLGLVLGLSGVHDAAAFPKPKYATSVDAPAPAPSTPPPATPPSDADPAIPDRETTKPSSAKPSAAKPAAARSAVASGAPRAAAPSPAGSGGWSIYQVRPGDTLTGVGRRFGANAKTLSDLNELEPKAPLKTGMKLKLPPGTVDKGKDPYASGPSPTRLSDASAPAPHHALTASAKTAKPAMTAEGPAATSEPYRARPMAAEPGAAPLPRAVAASDPGIPRSAETWTPKTTPSEKPVAVAKAPSEAVASGRGRFVWPVRGEVVTRFGPLGPGQRNDGVNIAADEGARVQAAAGGEVVYAGPVPGFGSLVLLKHADGWVTAYAHLASISVKMRDQVAQGQAIGAVGRSGGMDRPQLHFETRFAALPHEKARPVDPLALLPQ
jgi:murein DD-endopeptidase MepM/ murein hydrolase activator NlpD